MVCQDYSQISISGQLELAPVQLDNLVEQWTQLKLSIKYGHLLQIRELQGGMTSKLFYSDVMLT